MAEEEAVCKAEIKIDTNVSCAMLQKQLSSRLGGPTFVSMLLECISNNSPSILIAFIHGPEWPESYSVR